MLGTKKSAEIKCDKCIFGKTVIYMSNQILGSAISKMKKKTHKYFGSLSKLFRNIVHVKEFIQIKCKGLQTC